MDKHTLLRRYYGYTEFRPGQEPLIDGVLNGHDVFGIMPTGGGKSLCYQIPALLLPGITLVISPLISLMQDQVLALEACGVSAVCLNSTLTASQTAEIYRGLSAAQYKLVYVAPERLDQPGFAALAARLPIRFVAVDEAHCISQWGQDFRPSYLRIVRFLQELPQRPVVGAYTATATAKVRLDVARILGLRDPVTVTTGFDRSNLFFDVLRPKDKDSALLKLLAENTGRSGIVYCSTRKNVESVCQMLQHRGYAATRYHAGLAEQERRGNQEDFIHDRKTIMVATNAFGMGIDKSNVSFVIHYNMPKSMEAYYQEAGRAGRDGTDASCVLLYSGADVATAKFLIEQDAGNEELTPEQQELVRQENLTRLYTIITYCKTPGCLRSFILYYFGQRSTDFCGNCGNCRGDFEVVDITRYAQMILSCLKRVYDKLGYSVGVTTICQVLRGSRSKNILDKRLDQLSTYGLMRNVSLEKLNAMLATLEAACYIVTEPSHSTLRLTTKAADVLYKKQPVTMKVPKSTAPVTQAKATTATTLSPADSDLFDLLKALRTQLARKSSLAPFMVFSNATLMDMAIKKPRTLTEFRRISGVGELKASWYSEDFLKVINGYLDSL